MKNSWHQLNPGREQLWILFEFIIFIQIYIGAVYNV